MAAGLVPAGARSFGLRLAGERLVRDPAGPWDSAGAYAVRAGLLARLEPGPADLVARVLGPLLERGGLAGWAFRGPMADAGTLARLLDVSAGVLAGRWPYALPPGRAYPGVGPGPVFAGPGAEVDPAAVLAGPVMLDAGARVGPGAVVTRAVVGPGAVVGPAARVVGSFLGPGAHVPPGTTATAALVPATLVPAGRLPGPPAERTGPTRSTRSTRVPTRRLDAESPGGGA
jgi:mannose-1-phosphate guanylyltransferase